MAKETSNPNFERDRSSRGRQRDESPLKQLLESESHRSIFDSELRAEIRHMFEVLQRIEELAEQELERVGLSAHHPPRVSVPAPSTEEPEAAQSDVTELDIGGHIVAFDPAEFNQPPQAASPVFHPASGGSPHDESSADKPAEFEQETAQDDHLQRWWVNFNGDVSLERLSRLRRILNDSPFTIEARFDEITDGLIVLRVVTERHFSTAQLEWIVWQVMDAVGLDRKAAILSRN